jgi:hypothetical protein
MKVIKALKIKDLEKQQYLKFNLYGLTFNLHFTSCSLFIL